MEVKVIFIYETKTFLFTCSTNEEMEKMFQKFVSKLNPEANTNDFEYYYEGNELTHESTIGKNKYIGQKKDILITVEKKVRIYKCPKCICNDCILCLNNYQIAYYGCKYNHMDFSVYDNYKNSQKIDFSEIRCSANGGCPHTQKTDPKDFYKCLTCTKMLGHSKYYCHEHNEAHDKYHTKVKYDQKNYFCEGYFHQFVRYCFTCKKNLCTDCVEEHSDHKTAVYEDMAPDMDTIKKNLKDIKDFIHKLHLVIDDIKYYLEGTARIYERYYDIASDIIKKYETFNQNAKNYRLLRTIRNLKFSNEKIMSDLKRIINEKDLQSKSKNIIETYINKIEFYKGKKVNDIKNITELQNDNDDKWWEDIKEFNKERSRRSSGVQGRPQTTASSKKSSIKKGPNDQ